MGNSPGKNLMGGNFPGGSFPGAIFLIPNKIYVINVIKNIGQLKLSEILDVILSSKNVLFSNVHAFLSKKVATFKKSYKVWN